jgi:hypothetical protein
VFGAGFRIAQIEVAAKRCALSRAATHDAGGSIGSGLTSLATSICSASLVIEQQAGKSQIVVPLSGNEWEIVAQDPANLGWRVC